MAALWLFLKSPLGRWVGGALALLTIAGVIYGKGQLDARQAQAERDRAQKEKNEERWNDATTDINGLTAYRLCRANGGLHGDCQRLLQPDQGTPGAQ
jgi:hypothetical protein